MPCNCWDCNTSRRARKDYRQSAGTPDEEVPRHKSVRRKKKTHVHTYEKRVIGQETKFTYHYKWENGVRTNERVRHEYTADKTVFVCTGCGNKRHYYGSHRYL